MKKEKTKNTLDTNIKQCFFYCCPADLSPDVLAELVAKVPSSRLKFVLADSIFRNLCCRNGSTVGDEPLSLKKLVCAF